MGDPAGIGPEIVVKALASPDIHTKCIPIVIGDRISLEYACSYCGPDMELRPVTDVSQCQGLPGTIEFLDPGVIKSKVQLGKVDATCGEAAFRYVTTAIGMAMDGTINAVVTAPINKESINLAGHDFPGHTEIFAHYTNTHPGQYAMMLASGNLRVIHATTHVSLRNACDLITTDRVLKTIRLARQGVEAMGVINPRIGVAGLNPHSSENGLFGSEEETAIIPAIMAAIAEGVSAEGPIPPDTIFVKAMGGIYDVVVAMYHDQGHIPLKLHGFRLSNEAASVGGINATIGLPIIRTSVDHGTAFDRAGKNTADPQSLIDAIDMAIKMSNATSAC